MAYYRRLRDLREDNDYTQKQIADILFTTQPQYYRYESGLRDLPCELLIILAKYYHTSTDYILGLTDTK
ncbi:MAG: helix-turn-helix transcriptional regulator [Oscillospiraceae bacterium]|nr:helix-turn-helix transcriptional regulator [Oscillospiraceae bacterium]